MKKLLKPSIIVFLLVSSSSAEMIEIEKNSFRTSFETVKISSNEDMGLLGTSYLFEKPNDIYYGFGLYSAITGQRGGFFVGGFHFGYKYPLIQSLSLDLGGFVGGGGGGAAPQGGGLMLRSYGGLHYQKGDYGVGVSYSNVTFPNGDIQSNQIAVHAQTNFESLYFNPPLDIEILKKYNIKSNRDYIVGTYQYYKPEKKSLKTDNKPLQNSIKLVGIEYGMLLNDHLLAYLESAAAMGGESAGYMEVLGGVGYNQPLFLDDLNLQAKISLGAGGGGRVKTDGGGITKSSIGFNYGKKIHLGAEVGYYHAIEDDFDAKFAKVNLGMNTNFLSLSKSKEVVDYDSLTIQKFNLRVLNQTYLYNQNITPKKNGLDIHLIGMKIDYLIDEHLYLSGQGYGAYKGEAGGYAVGLLGAGYIQPLPFNFSIYAECAFGAAGGGSIQSGEGSVIQPSIGVLYDLTRNYSLFGSVGQIKALNGELDTHMIEFGIQYRFNKLRLR